MAGIRTLIDGNGVPFRVFVYAPGNAKRSNVRVVILPGANCAAERYRWLAGALAEEGATVLIPDPPPLEHASPLGPSARTRAALVSVDQMIRTLAIPSIGHAQDTLTFAVGHSLGGTVILEYLDPAQSSGNPRSGVHAGYRPPTPLDGVVIAGASMQTEVMGFTLPWRQNDTRLVRPDGLPVLFIAGEHDRLVPPHQVSATVARYDPPTALVVQRGANDFGWTDGEGALDRHDLDGAATLSPEDQKAGTLRLTRTFFSAIAAREPGGLAGRLRRASAKGDTVAVRQAD